MFSNLTGGRSRDDIAGANAQAQRYLQQGQTGAENAYTSSYNNSLNAMLQGRDQSLAALGMGYDRSNQQLNTSFGQAANQLNQGYDSAIGASEDYLRRTQNVLNPYIQQGDQAQDMYGRAIGLQGADAQRQFLDQYSTADPFRQHNEDMANRAMMRQANASGRKFSGQTDLAMARASLDRGSQDYENYINRLQGQANQGQQFAGAMAQYTNQTGQQVAGYQADRGTGQANLTTGLGNQLSGNYINQGNQTADLQTNYGNNLANTHTNYGSNIANTRMNTAQGQANNAFNTGAATAGTRSSGLNNMLGLAATGLQGYSTYRQGRM